MSRHIVCRTELLANTTSAPNGKMLFRVVWKNMEHVKCNFIYFGELGPMCAAHPLTPANHTRRHPQWMRHQSNTWNTERKLENCCMQLNDNSWNFFRQGHETNSFRVPNARIQCSRIYFCLTISTLRYSQSQIPTFRYIAWRSTRTNGHRRDTESFVFDFPFGYFINLGFGNPSILSLFQLKAPMKGLNAINSVNLGDLRQLSFRLLKHFSCYGQQIKDKMENIRKRIIHRNYSFENRKKRIIHL